MNNPFVTLDIPVVETARLILRGNAPSDFDAMQAMFADPEAGPYIPGGVTVEDNWNRFLKCFGGWAVAGYGMFAVEDKASGGYAGTAGCFPAKRGMDSRLDGISEAGWIVGTRFQGRGYATEAMLAALAWMDKCYALPVYCMIEPGNAQSIRVAGKTGFAPWFSAEHKGVAVDVFLRPAP